MSELINYLSHGEHPVVLQRYKDAHELEERVQSGYVLVKFTDTRGGTELGLRLDKDRCDLTNLDTGSGTIKLVGTLTLDFVDIEVVVDANITSLEGTGTVAIQAEATEDDVL
jgi:hypothetical protein